MASRVDPPTESERGLGEIVNEVTDKASFLVREEIELAKAEVQLKAARLGRGVAIGAAAGFFGVFLFNFFLHTLAYLFTDLLDIKVWVGFGIVTLILLLLTALAGFLAYRFVKKGAPPTPDLAIEEAKRTREAIEEVRS